MCNSFADKDISWAFKPFTGDVFDATFEVPSNATVIVRAINCNGQRVKVQCDIPV